MPFAIAVALVVVAVAVAGVVSSSQVTGSHGVTGLVMIPTDIWYQGTSLHLKFCIQKACVCACFTIHHPSSLPAPGSIKPPACLLVEQLHLGDNVPDALLRLVFLDEQV